MRVRIAGGFRKAEVEEPVLLADRLLAELTDHGGRALRSRCHVERRLLEMEAVHDDQVGFRERLGIGRRRLERVRVRGIRDEPAEADPIASDIAGDRADRRDGGRDVELVSPARERVLPAEASTGRLRSVRFARAGRAAATRRDKRDHADGDEQGTRGPAIDTLDGQHPGEEPREGQAGRQVIATRCNKHPGVPGDAQPTGARIRPSCSARVPS